MVASGIGQAIIPGESIPRQKREALGEGESVVIQKTKHTCTAVPAAIMRRTSPQFVYHAQELPLFVADIYSLYRQEQQGTGIEIAETDFQD